MPSFLIVRSATQDGRIDAFRQPPTLDVGGLRAPLDWGDVTLHVPAGDLPVTLFVTRADGQVEGSTITVRVPAGTGTRLTFVPPDASSGRAQLRIDGQWPSDASMYYYAARDARVLVPATTPIASAPAPPSGGRGGAQLGLVAPSPSPVVPDDAELRILGTSLPQPSAPTPAVGPTPGSTASVPPQGSSFGQRTGALVDPVLQSDAPSTAPVGAMRHPAAQPPPAPAGPPQERDVYGRAVGAGAAAPIPTPAEFDRLERASHEQQARAYEAWLAAQRPAARRPGGDPHQGAPTPVGLAPGSAHQARQDWYPDPFRRADLRWFDGRGWTSSVMRGGLRGTDQPG